MEAKVTSVELIQKLLLRKCICTIRLQQRMVMASLAVVAHSLESSIRLLRTSRRAKDGVVLSKFTNSIMKPNQSHTLSTTPSLITRLWEVEQSSLIGRKVCRFQAIILPGMKLLAEDKVMVAQYCTNATRLTLNLLAQWHFLTISSLSTRQIVRVVPSGMRMLTSPTCISSKTTK